MKKFILCLALLTPACSSMPKVDLAPTNPAKEQIDAVKRNTYTVLRENVQKSTPPLDLSEYKDIRFRIDQKDGQPLVSMHYNDFSRMMTMLGILGTRIEVQRAYLDTTLDLLERDLKPQDQSQSAP